MSFSFEASLAADTLMNLTLLLDLVFPGCQVEKFVPEWDLSLKNRPRIDSINIFYTMNDSEF